MTALKRKYFVGGQLVDGDRVFDVVCPATKETVAKVAWSSAARSEAALDAACSEFEGWSRANIGERDSWMNRLLEVVVDKQKHIQDCIHIEMGKPGAESQVDGDGLVDSLQFCGKAICRFRLEALADREGSRSNMLVHEPVSVVAAFIARNSPFLDLALKDGPAVAVGCPIIIEPSFMSLLSAYGVGEIFHQTGLPDGVVNIICGDDSVVGNALSASTAPAMLFLLAPLRTGCHIIKTDAASTKRNSMNLGGNAPVLVFADADSDLDADVVGAVRFGSLGQICVTPDRMFVEAAVADEISRNVVYRSNGVRPGYDKDGVTGVRPLIDSPEWQRVDGLYRSATAMGVLLRTGGSRSDGFTSGQILAPIVLTGVQPELAIYSEEILGPVVCLMDFTDEEDVVQKANDSESGLTAHILTCDPAKAERLAARLRFSEAQDNGIKYGIDRSHVGIKQSGVRRDCSHLAPHDNPATQRKTLSLAA